MIVRIVKLAWNSSRRFVRTHRWWDLFSWV
jgi:hypothetical protein